MIKSMTGYGKSSADIAGKKITVEIKSLNSKQMDIALKMPLFVREKEMEIRNLIASVLERGKVDFSVVYENTDANTDTQLNFEAIKSHYRNLKQLGDELGAVSTDYLNLIFKLPDVFANNIGELNDDEWDAIKSAITECLNNVDEYRKAEGETIMNDFACRITNIGNLLDNVSKFEANRIEVIKERLSKSLNEIADSTKVDANRFEQELIYYIEKIDINEEKVRLRQHLEYFVKTVYEEQSQGKKLLFIAQEMGREINTLGSKANDFNIQQIVVQMKDELEKIKEQLGNVL